MSDSQHSIQFEDDWSNSKEMAKTKTQKYKTANIFFNTLRAIDVYFII
jgi:hypothetical protein